MMEFMNCRETLAGDLQTPEERGHTFALCNLAAPSMLQSNCLAFYGSCASCMAQGQNLMAVIMLQFGYSKGKLYIASRKIEDLFIDRGLNMDCTCAFVFKEKCDNRDDRTWCTMAA